MRVPRIYSPQALAEGALLALEPQAARHVHQVLRLRAGNALSVFDGQGAEFSATIEHTDRKQVSVRLGAAVNSATTESPLAVELGIAISKGDRMDWVIQKATELGVSSIVPLFTRRVDVRLNAERREKKQQHWQQVVISACEQCGRSQLPALQTARELDQWLGGVQAEERWVLAPGEASLREAAKPASIALLIGPEGGLEEAEIDRAQKAGFKPLSLGPRVLRTETAPLAALAIIQHLWGDM